MNVTRLVCGLITCIIFKSYSSFFSLPVGLLPARSFKYRTIPLEKPTKIPSDLSLNWKQGYYWETILWNSLTTLGSHFKLVTSAEKIRCDNKSCETIWLIRIAKSKESYVSKMNVCFYNLQLPADEANRLYADETSNPVTAPDINERMISGATLFFENVKSNFQIYPFAS